MSDKDNAAVDRQIEQMISSDDSVVGIDAKKYTYYHNPEAGGDREPAGSP